MILVLIVIYVLLLNNNIKLGFVFDIFYHFVMYFSKHAIKHVLSKSKVEILFEERNLIKKYPLLDSRGYIYRNLKYKSDYEPKSSKCSISGGTPKLSSMPFTAFAIGPGPHM